ncbi:hypothetical protein GN330_13675 [Nitratireductor sp. CAU 1489]|uniref:Uncharacterized protein n=1 Tax=Nitratireductor arenosus TaxID=2682096 RepID=A0A844QI63_9HYPH|nr:hypothetical protein [Nitratireductor arenosus]MVA98294.1 hypothetical protein [Nitratireductor arenosus]
MAKDDTNTGNQNTQQTPKPTVDKQALSIDTILSFGDDKYEMMLEIPHHVSKTDPYVFSLTPDPNSAENQIVGADGAKHPAPPVIKLKLGGGDNVELLVSPPQRLLNGLNNGVVDIDKLQIKLSNWEE